MKPLRAFQRPLCLFLVFVIAGSVCSCYSRRQMATTRLTEIDVRHLEFFALDLRAPDRNLWALSNVQIEAQGLSARFDRPPPQVAWQITAVHKNADLKRNKNRVLIYIHPAMAKTYSDTLTTYLNYTDIAKIEVFEPDAGKTIGVALAVTVGCFITVGLIVISSLQPGYTSTPSPTASQGDCNCPHVYTQTPDGHTYLEGSLYSGAIYPTLERDDYLPLQYLQSNENQYHIRLANQEKQHQHTNFVSLEVLDHAPGLPPVFDQYGQLHTLTSPQSPLAATNVSGQDVLNEVRGADESIFIGDLHNERPDATERLTLTFAKPAQAQQAKLLLHAKNNDWLDYTYGQFQNALGQYADAVARKQRQLPAAKNLAWAERQKIPLVIWVETRPGHWEKADYFHPVGTSAFRQIVLPLDLSRVPGDLVRVRLEFGFHFWEIDYAALDFSTDQPVLQTTLRPVSAMAQTGEDLQAALTDDDDHYYDQPHLGDEAQIAFAVPPLVPGQTRSLVLRAKGHYEIVHTSAPGRPRLSQLKAWNRENALPRLSRERWRQMTHLSAITMAQSDSIKPKRIYRFVSLGVGLPLSGRAAMEVITPKGFSCSLFAFLSTKRSPNTPSDYRAFSLSGPEPFVYESLEMAGFTVGRAWWVDDAKRIRFNLKGGLAYGSFEYPVNFRRPQAFVLFGSSYDYDWEKHYILDIVLQPTLEFTLIRSFALTMSPFAHLNKYRAIIGVEGAVAFGQIREERPRRK